MTDGQGRVVNFKNTIVIMTSNIGSDVIQELDDKEEIALRIDEALKQHFRPEFLNRIDEKIIFNRLQKDDIIRIIDIQVKNLKDRLKEKGITLEVSEEAKAFLAEKGYDPVYGARPLNRAIQKYVQDPIATMLLEGRVREKGHIRTDINRKGELEFEAET